MASICLSGKINLVYVHIPKTAGVSISRWLINHRGNNFCEILRNHPTLQHIKERKSTFYEAIGDIQSQTNDPFIFTTVRNPWARTWSAYQNLYRHYNSKSTEKQHAYDIIFEILNINKKWPSFETFVHLMPELTAGVEPFWNTMTPQSFWINDSVHLIIKVENINKDFRIIQDKFNIYDPLPVLNTSDNLCYRAQYNHVTKSLVGCYFEEDINRWEYTFND